MKLTNKVFAVLVASTSLHSYADSGASENGSAASRHSVLAAAHGTVASVQVGSAVIATPLLVVGSVGNVAGESGVKLLDMTFDNKPLEVTDKTITAAPAPKDAMKINQPEKL